MNSTTANRRIRLRTVLVVSLVLQTVGLVLFVSCDALRRTRMTTEQEDVLERNREARERLELVERKKREQREHTELKKEDAERLARNIEREQAEKMIRRIEDMRSIRDELEQVEAAKMEDITRRDPAEVSLSLYDRLHPLALALATNAVHQDTTQPLPASPAVAEAASVFLRRVESDRSRLLEPEVFDELQALHDTTRERQGDYNHQLDDAQAGYRGDADRLRRENHIEYQVNCARDRISDLLGQANPVMSTDVNTAPPFYEPPESGPTDAAPDLSDLSAPELFHEAETLFEAIRSSFEAARAADMALENRMPLTEAFDAVAAPPPPSGFSPDQLPFPPGTVGELNEYREGLTRAVQNVNDLWQRAHTMGAAGRTFAGIGSGTGEQSPPGSAQTDGQGGAGGGESRGASAARAAGGGDGGRFVDMTPFMLAGGSDGSGYGGGGGGGIDMTHRSQRSGYQSSGDMETVVREPSRLSEQEIIKEALPGRRFSRSSTRTGWLYIDTWYVIGPFENHGRVDFRQTFPPETLVDLDASYPGKAGRTVTWQFHQSDNIRVKPPDESESSTYYGYTEVYFDETTEMMIAVASDDTARIWINGVRVWEDAGNSPWRLDEGFRKVVFNQGFNTILLRIDNGPVTCTFSLLLCPPDAVM